MASSKTFRAEARPQCAGNAPASLQASTSSRQYSRLQPVPFLQIQDTLKYRTND